MGTKLIITESQLDRLKTFISESVVYSDIVKQIHTDLTANYTPTDNFVRKGGEYSNKRMIKVNVDDEIISPKALFDYLQYKYDVGDAFIKQIITDWMSGSISDTYQLTKNVPLT